VAGSFISSLEYAFKTKDFSSEFTMYVDVIYLSSEFIMYMDLIYLYAES
jgi:hypothetical protein